VILQEHSGIAYTLGLGSRRRRSESRSRSSSEKCPTSGGDNENPLSSCPCWVGHRFYRADLCPTERYAGRSTKFEQLKALGKKYDEAVNNNDAAAYAALYTEDGVEVTDAGPIYGREAIEKHYTDLFKQIHFTNSIGKSDQYSPHIIGTAGNETWDNRQWSETIQGKNFGPIQLKGYYSSIQVLEGNTWKMRMLTWNITPAPTATPSSTPTPSSQ
jgi:ketosteroid isomerase-like protein